MLAVLAQAQFGDPILHEKAMPPSRAPWTYRALALTLAPALALTQPWDWPYAYPKAWYQSCH